MTCSLFHVRGHNKRGCHLRSDGVGSTVREQSATPITEPVAEPSSSRNERGRSKKPDTNECEPVAKRGRGRPRTTDQSRNASALRGGGSAGAGASRGAPSSTVPPSNRTTATSPRQAANAGASRGAPRSIVPPSNITITATTSPRHGASAGASRGGKGRGRGVNHPLESWFTYSQGSTTNDVGQNADAAPKETALGNRNQFKRPRVTGMGVFQAENGFKTFNPGLSSSRILSTGPKRVLRSFVVTGDIGFKPTSGLKWKENQAITTRML